MDADLVDGKWIDFGLGLVWLIETDTDDRIPY